MLNYLLPFLLFFYVLNAQAETPQEQGLRIMTEREARNEGFADSSATMLMTLKNKNGQTSIRRLHSKVLEMKNDGDKSLLLFDSPADLKGTALLTFSHGLKTDDQWIYLPAFKRVKRISSRNKSGPFMASEFAFEDLSSQEIEKYNNTYLRQEVCAENMTCHVIESIPVYQDSGYTKLIRWIDTEEYRIVKTEFYDRKATLLKTLISSQFTRYLNQYWRPAVMTMKNHQTGKITILAMSNYAFRTGLTLRDFNKNALKR